MCVEIVSMVLVILIEHLVLVLVTPTAHMDFVVCLLLWLSRGTSGPLRKCQCDP